MERGVGGHQSRRAGKSEWLTPPEIIAALGPFDLDPCAPVDRPWCTAATHYTIHDDGLRQPWRGFCFVNPPYGSATRVWLDKLASHPGGGIALVFARTETEAFVSQVWERASSLLFLFGRLHFHHVSGERATNNSGAPSVLIGYGELATERLRNCGLDGAFVPDWTVAAPFSATLRIDTQGYDTDPHGCH